MRRVRVVLAGITALLAVLVPGPAQAVEPGAVQRDAAAIVGGTNSPQGGQPWMVALLYKTPTSSKPAARQFCGGALVAPDWVLTAAHCIEKLDPDAFELVIGREQLNGNGGEVREAAELIVHPRFARDRFGADIALIRLRQSSSAQPLRRASAAEERALFSSSVDIYGWGYHSYRSKYACDTNFAEPTNDFADYWCESFVYSYGTNPADMQDGRLRLASYAECDTRYREYLISLKTPQPLPAAPYFSEQLTPQVLCAWDPGAVQSACFGDSGGPLVGVAGNTPILLGVVSFGYVADCARQGQLGIYSRVSYHGGFIDEALTREQGLGFAALCPRRPTLDVAVAAATSGGARVTATWAQDHAANGWRLYYANAGAPGAAPNSIDLPAGQNSYAVNLPVGATYYVVLQARGVDCDSPMSSLRKVAIP